MERGDTDRARQLPRLPASPPASLCPRPLRSLRLPALSSLLSPSPHPFDFFSFYFFSFFPPQRICLCVSCELSAAPVSPAWPPLSFPSSAPAVAPAPTSPWGAKRQIWASVYKSPIPSTRLQAAGAVPTPAQNAAPAFRGDGLYFYFWFRQLPAVFCSRVMAVASFHPTLFPLPGVAASLSSRKGKAAGRWGAWARGARGAERAPAGTFPSAGEASRAQHRAGAAPVSAKAGGGCRGGAPAALPGGFCLPDTLLLWVWGRWEPVPLLLYRGGGEVSAQQRACGSDSERNRLGAGQAPQRMGGGGLTCARADPRGSPPTPRQTPGPQGFPLRRGIPRPPAARCRWCMAPAAARAGA